MAKTGKNSIKKKTVLITGGLGFIGSVYAWYLNYNQERNIVLCDHFRSEDKWKNVRGLLFSDIIAPEHAADYIRGRLLGQKTLPRTVIHLGACSSTTEQDMDFLFRNNYEFSKDLWEAAREQNIPFFYASSAATYGNGSKRGDFSCRLPIASLRPLNKYGYSKQLFDLWVEEQVAKRLTPPAYGGIKFFNVFGPQEYHKGSMASVVFHAYHQIKASGRVKLFKSYHPDYPDGGQVRDFVYIKDVCRVMDEILSPKNKPIKSKTEKEKRDQGFLHNLGSGKAHTFIDLVTPIFTALGLKTDIEFIEMPESLRPNYQYFTEAEMGGKGKDLAPAVIDYVRHLEEEPYLSTVAVKSQRGRGWTQDRYLG